MKNIFKYTNNTDFYKMTLALESLFAEVLRVKESFSWNEYANSHNLIMEKLTSNIQMLHDDVLSYQMMLASFVENADYFEDTSCVDKFLNGEITAVRTKAIKSLRVLLLKAESSNNEEDRTQLLRVVADLKEVVNEYLGLVRDILEHNRKLQTILLSRNIYYKDKYDLSDI